MKLIAPSALTRAIIGIVIVALFSIPLISTLLFTLNDPQTGELSLTHWTNLFTSAKTAVSKPLITGLVNSLILAAVTVCIVLFVLAPTMILVNLKFPKLRAAFEFAALLPISIPAIVVVVGLAPIYLLIGRTVGTGAWTLAFAYGVFVLPYAFRSIQASIDAVDLRTLAEAARTLGASWPSVLWRVLAPNLRAGLLASSLISVAVVLGEFTIASLLNRQVLQTALVLVQKTDPYAAAIITLLALAFCFLLLLVIGLMGRGRDRKATS